MKDKHKNMLFGFLAAKAAKPKYSSTVDEDDVFQALFHIAVPMIGALLTVVWLDSTFSWSAARLIAIGFILCFVYMFALFWIRARFPILLTLLWSIPLVSLLIWALFFS